MTKLAAQGGTLSATLAIASNLQGGEGQASFGELADLSREAEALEKELTATQKALGECRAQLQRARLELVGVSMELTGWIEDEETPAHVSHGMGQRLASIIALADTIERPGWRRD